MPVARRVVPVGKGGRRGRYRGLRQDTVGALTGGDRPSSSASCLRNWSRTVSERRLMVASIATGRRARPTASRVTEPPLSHSFRRLGAGHGRLGHGARALAAHQRSRLKPALLPSRAGTPAWNLWSRVFRRSRMVRRTSRASHGSQGAGQLADACELRSPRYRPGSRARTLRRFPGMPQAVICPRAQRVTQPPRHLRQIRASDHQDLLCLPGE